VNALTEQLGGLDNESDFFAGFTYGRLLCALAWFDLTGWELPRKAPLLHSTLRQEEFAFIQDDGGGDRGSFLGCSGHEASLMTSSTGG
jgi:hypothetical protein